MAGRTEILPGVLDQSLDFVAMNCVASRALQLGAGMRVIGGHVGLVLSHVTGGTDTGLTSQRLVSRICDVLLGRITQMLLPTTMAADATNGDLSPLPTCGCELVR